MGELVKVCPTSDVADNSVKSFEVGNNVLAVYNVGGGVVFDSSAEAEYAECLLKARFATGTQPVST